MILDMILVKQLYLADDEHITSVKLCHGAVMDSMTFVTNKGKSFKWGGEGGSV